MSSLFFRQLEMPEPHWNLEVGSGTHAEQTGAMLTKLEALLSEVRPDAVLTYGDTNSTLAATLAATKIHLPVLHIEAGLRSFNRSMPEEINRLVADHCGDRLYAPTPLAMRNLRSEGLESRAVLTGDVMLDAIRRNAELARERSRVLHEIGVQQDRFGLVTVHRPVNTEGEALKGLMRSLERIASRSFPLVFPVHPRTRLALQTLRYTPPKNLMLLEPMSYLDNVRLISQARLVITDSGGVQKEAAFLGTPCLTVRGETEWVETVEIGLNRLVADPTEELASAVAEVLSAPDPFGAEAWCQIEEHYGSGDAALKIVTDCVAWLH
jgi:UDP-N-acetylglucosamine 2-epimerase